MGAEVVFGVVGGVGLVLLLASLLLGDLLDGVVEGLDELLPGADWLSGPTVGAFLAAFGFVGLVVESAQGAVLPALGAGAAAGTGAGLAAAAGYRALTRVRTDATPTSRDLVGTEGQVVTAIADSGYGEVVVRLAGSPVKLSAQSDVPVERGSRVWVSEVLSATAVRVRPVDALGPGGAGGELAGG